MSLLGTLFKVAVVAGGVVVCQRMWDRYQLEDLYVELDAIVDRVRADKARVGTVRANVKVEGRTLLEKYESRMTYVDSLNELRKNFEIYIESIPD